MNNKSHKLLYIRSKNNLKKRGYDLSKWKVKNKKHPFQWVNTNSNKSILEESCIIDFMYYGR